MSGLKKKLRKLRKHDNNYEALGPLLKGSQGLSPSRPYVKMAQVKRSNF